MTVAFLRTNSGCTWVVCERVVAALRTRSGRDSRDPVSWSHCRDGKPSSWYESASESLIAQCWTGMRFQLCKDHKWPLGPALPCSWLCSWQITLYNSTFLFSTQLLACLVLPLATLFFWRYGEWNKQLIKSACQNLLKGREVSFLWSYWSTSSIIIKRIINHVIQMQWRLAFNFFGLNR